MYQVCYVKPFLRRERINSAPRRGRAIHSRRLSLSLVRMACRATKRDEPGWVGGAQLQVAKCSPAIYRRFAEELDWLWRLKPLGKDKRLIAEVEVCGTPNLRNWGVAFFAETH